MDLTKLKHFKPTLDFHHQYQFFVKCNDQPVFIDLQMLLYPAIEIWLLPH